MAVTHTWRGDFKNEEVNALHAEAFDHRAGWQLKVRQDERARIRATRADVELEVTGASLEEAAGIVFARAMRSSHLNDRLGSD
jgi:hypothetical protein